MKRKTPSTNARLPTLSTAEEELLQECIDTLDELSAQSGPYPETVLAFALRVNLASVLTTLLAMETWSPEQISGFIQGLKQAVLEPETD